MAETLQKNPEYSGEPVATMTVESPPESGEFPLTEKAWQSLKQTRKPQMVAFLEFIRTPGYPRWLIAAGAILGLLTMVPLVERVWERARDARERRYEQAVASVTPDRLIARCGQPTEDATKQVFPILIRTLGYQRKGKKKIVLQFSRTAEEKSDWVFLTMQDERGARNYDTPEAKVAALPCLDSIN
jgi:uncharacterized membrane protein